VTVLLLLPLHDVDSGSLLHLVESLEQIFTTVMSSSLRQRTKATAWGSGTLILQILQSRATTSEWKGRGCLEAR
jgi:hypothetical protein